jgi:hypothetical protein
MTPVHAAYPHLPSGKDAAEAVARMTPISGDESTVTELVAAVHALTCGPNGHDPLCNTMRLLAEDYRVLAGAELHRRGRGL